MTLRQLMLLRAFSPQLLLLRSSLLFQELSLLLLLPLERIESKGAHLGG